MMPRGLNSRIASSSMSNGCSSQYTPISHAAGDQLGVLGTEIEDQDAVSVNVEGHDNLVSEIGTTRGCVTARFGIAGSLSLRGS
jgi:hypothetical protein